MYMFYCALKISWASKGGRHHLFCWYQIRPPMARATQHCSFIAHIPSNTKALTMFYFTASGRVWADYCFAKYPSRHLNTHTEAMRKGHNVKTSVPDMCQNRRHKKIRNSLVRTYPTHGTLRYWKSQYPWHNSVHHNFQVATCTFVDNKPMTMSLYYTPEQWPHN